MALNASIEAANAGAAGRGFAVIAGEIRKLSKSTSSDVDRVDQFLHTISDGIKGLVGVNREVKQVFKDLSGKIQSLDIMLHEVSGKMNQLSTSSNHILELMKQ